jgi:outer membrane receptor protein involved in Fe transport
MNLAAYVQDDWRLTPKLTVNLGLRYAYVSPMKEANN